MEARILETTRQRSPDGSTHVSRRELGRLLKMNHNHAQAWQRAGLHPHRFERYMQSDEPDFERKSGRSHQAVSEPAASCGDFRRRRRDRD
jgi:hypothetical protein